MRRRYLKQIKYLLKFTSILLISLILIDQTLLKLYQEKIMVGNMNRGDVFRAPAPYIEFKGKPLSSDHNEYGYRFDLNEKSDAAIKIAFFGGSTGYLGNPPLPTILENDLEKLTHKKIKVANFSVISSNHRQHLHNLLETRSFFQPDIVIFYGGYNETAQNGFYDPRPGYPYNYFFRNETSPLFQWLMSNSPSVYLLNNLGIRYRLWDWTGLNKLKTEANVFTSAWNKTIVNNYFETQMLAKSVSEGFPSKVCGGHTQFLFFYQPYQLPEQFPQVAELNNQIVQKFPQIDYGHDLSTILDGPKKSEKFDDIVHVKQEVNQLIGLEIAKRLITDKRLVHCWKP